MSDHHSVFDDSEKKKLRWQLGIMAEENPQLAVTLFSATSAACQKALDQDELTDISPTLSSDINFTLDTGKNILTRMNLDDPEACILACTILKTEAVCRDRSEAHNVSADMDGKEPPLDIQYDIDFYIHKRQDVFKKLVSIGTHEALHKAFSMRYDRIRDTELANEKPDEIVRDLNDVVTGYAHIGTKDAVDAACDVRKWQLKRVKYISVLPHLSDDYKAEVKSMIVLTNNPIIDPPDLFGDFKNNMKPGHQNGPKNDFTP